MLSSSFLNLNPFYKPICVFILNISPHLNPSGALILCSGVLWTSGSTILKTHIQHRHLSVGVSTEFTCYIYLAPWVKKILANLCSYSGYFLLEYRYIWNKMWKSMKGMKTFPFPSSYWTYCMCFQSAIHSMDAENAMYCLCQVLIPK